MLRLALLSSVTETRLHNSHQHLVQMVHAAAAVDLTAEAASPCSAKRPRPFSAASGGSKGGASTRHDWEQGWLDVNQCCICAEPWDSSGPRCALFPRSALLEILVLLSRRKLEMCP